MELPNLIAVICGFTAFFISVVESAWVRWHYFPTAFKESCRSIVGFAGLFSLANAMAALSSTSSVLFDDVSTVCRVAWCVIYCACHTLLLALLHIHLYYYALLHEHLLYTTIY